MNYTLTIDGVDCHARTTDEDDAILELIIDPDTNLPIPKTICLCAARSPSECCCGAWDDVVDSDWGDTDW